MIRSNCSPWFLCINTTVALISACLFGDSSGSIAGAPDPLAGTWISPPPDQYSDPWQQEFTYPNRDSIAERIVFDRENGMITGMFTSLFGEKEPLGGVKRERESISFLQDETRIFGEIHGTELHLFASDAKIGQGASIAWWMKWHGASRSRPYIFKKATASDLRIIREEPTYSFKKLPLPAVRNISTENLAPTPPMGVGNFVHANDAGVRSLADLMVSSGLRDAGYVYLQIDEGWQGRRDSEGKIHPNDGFPDMKALINYVHSKGLRFGIYSSPGPAACYGYAGSYGHEDQDAKTFSEWGVDYLKYDWCSAARIYATQSEMRAAYQKMGDALRSVRRPILYGLCQYGLFNVSTWGKSVGANLWRVADDLGNRWETLISEGFGVVKRLDHVGPDGWNDLDTLQVSFGNLNPDERRTQMTLWSIMAAPLFIQVSNNFAGWTTEQLEYLLNQEVISVDQDRLGQQGQRILKDGDTEVWSRPLSDGAVAVAVFNLGSEPRQVTFPWKIIHLERVKSARDLWKKVDLKSVSSNYLELIPPHGSTLLRVVAGA